MIFGQIARRPNVWLPLTANKNDNSVNAYTVSAPNITQTTGILGGTNRAYDFNGTSGYAQIQQASLVTSKGCISLWYKSDVTSVDQIILSNTWIGTHDYLVIRGLNGANKFRALVYDNNIDTTTPNDTNWHHVVLNWDNTTTWKAYVDGVLIGTGASSKNPVNAYYVLLGRQANQNGFWGTPYYFNGKMTDYKHTLSVNYTTGQIKMIYGQKDRIKS